MDRHQPGRRHHPAARAAAEHQPTVERRSRTCSATSRRNVARVGVLPHALGCDWGTAVRGHRAALERHRSAQTVAISRGVVTGPNGLVEKDTKTHAARRGALDDRALVVLADHAKHMHANAAACRITLAENAFVFSNTVGGSEPWYPDSASRSFRRLCKQEGLQGVRLHDLRHFVATQPLSAGVDVRTVAGRLGHRDAATTLNVYAHFLEQSDRAAADVMGRLIADEPERSGLPADPPERSIMNVASATTIAGT